MNREYLLTVILGGLLGGCFVLIYTYAKPKRKCPYCGNSLPRWRIPENSKQLYWGGWTCENCGREVKVNFWGKPKDEQKDK